MCARKQALVIWRMAYSRNGSSTPRPPLLFSCFVVVVFVVDGSVLFFTFVAITLLVVVMSLSPPLGRPLPFYPFSAAMSRLTAARSCPTLVHEERGPTLLPQFSSSCFVFWTVRFGQLRTANRSHSHETTHCESDRAYGR